MKKVLSFVLAVVFVLNIVVFLESSITTDNNIQQQASKQKLMDEDHGGLRG